ncbi:MAG: S16 family serine protease [Candidatus Aenigmatarchaeota archaeon]
MRVISVVAILSFVAIYFIGTFYLSDVLFGPRGGTLDFDTPIESFIATNDTGSNTSVTMYVPAVNSNKEGVLSTINVDIVPGFGRPLVNIDNILFWVDTQTSIRTSRQIAGGVTGSDLSNYDMIYTIEADASVIEGGSAGAALTVATVAALTNKTPNTSVMMTGTIRSDGSIGPIGEVTAKAKVAKEHGIILFLVPLQQSTEIKQRSQETCRKIGEREICTTETVPYRVNVAEEAGLAVKEIATVQEALFYFLEE